MIELTETRVYRPFVGGMLLDVFSGKENPEDGHYPERWVCSTTSAGGDTGISKTPEGVLLTEYVKEPLDILVKLLDSYTRLMIQVHPTDELSQKLFDYPYGKTEAWYILGTREVNGETPYVFLGFKDGITRAHWEDVFYKQDIEAMEACLHKVPVTPGDVFYIPAMTPHAMGTGVFFAEVQQPTDITLRTERRSPDNREMAEFDLTHGASYDEMFDCFDYTGRDLEGTLKTYKVEKKGEVVLETPMFSMLEIDVETSRVIEADPYAIVMVLDGEDKGREFYLETSHEFVGKQKLLVCYGKK